MTPSITEIHFIVYFYKKEILACNRTNIDFISLQCIWVEASSPAVINTILQYAFNLENVLLHQHCTINNNLKQPYHSTS